MPLFRRYIKPIFQCFAVVLYSAIINFLLNIIFMNTSCYMDIINEKAQYVTSIQTEEIH